MNDIIAYYGGNRKSLLKIPSPHIFAHNLGEFDGLLEFEFGEYCDEVFNLPLRRHLIGSQLGCNPFIRIISPSAQWIKRVHVRGMGIAYF